MFTNILKIHPFNSKSSLMTKNKISLLKLIFSEKSWLKSLGKDGIEFLDWSNSNPVGKIPLAVAKEGAGENRVPFAHLANSVPVYLLFKQILDQNKTKQVRILDLGCGTGRNISFIKSSFSNKSFSFYGIDYSNACINYANHQYKRFGIKFKSYSGEKLPYPNNSFDYIVSSHVLEHIKKADCQRYFQEISRVLKKDALAVIGTPNRKYCQDLFFINPTDQKKFRLILPHEHEYYKEELETYFKIENKYFRKVRILQTINSLNRQLMNQATAKIKPQINLVGRLKFFIYSKLRSSGHLQDLMAKIGTELILHQMKVTYHQLVANTKLFNSQKDSGDNFILVLQK